jgi:hypothetical protein
MHVCWIGSRHTVLMVTIQTVTGTWCYVCVVCERYDLVRTAGIDFVTAAYASICRMHARKRSRTSDVSR